MDKDNLALNNLQWLIIFTPPLGQDMTQGQFFKAEFNRFELRVFPSPRLVASPRLKNLVCPTIYS